MAPQRRTRLGADRVLAELAARQHGVVGRDQILELGVGRHSIDGRRRRGHLHLLHRGVYAVGHRKLTQEARWMAAVLASGPEAVLSHRSAGQLWGLLARTGSVPEITRPTSFRPRSAIRTHQASLPDDEVEVVEGIAVTSANRALFDLAAVLKRRQMGQALNEAEVRQLASIVSLPDLLRRHPGQRGAMLLRELLEDEEALRGITKQELEARFAALIDAHGLPKPRRNADLVVGGRSFEVDCLWASARLIVELDGRAVHGTRRAFEEDRERDRHLVASGWRVVRITWRQVRDDGPAIAAELRSMLRPLPLDDEPGATRALPAR